MQGKLFLLVSSLFLSSVAFPIPSFTSISNVVSHSNIMPIGKRIIVGDDTDKRTDIATPIISILRSREMEAPSSKRSIEVPMYNEKRIVVPQEGASFPNSGKRQELDGGHRDSGKRQELDGGHRDSGKRQELDGGHRDSGKRQELDGGHRDSGKRQELDGGHRDSGKRQELDGGHRDSGKRQELDGGHRDSGKRQELDGGHRDSGKREEIGDHSNGGKRA